MKVRTLLQLSAFLFLAACSSGGQVGDSCTADEQCGQFKCLHDKRAMNNTCVNVTAPPDGTCSPSCTTHADCMKYGATLRCALAQFDVPCNPTGICLDSYTITCSSGSCRVAPAN